MWPPLASLGLTREEYQAIRSRVRSWAQNAAFPGRAAAEAASSADSHGTTAQMRLMPEPAADPAAAVAAVRQAPASSQLQQGAAPDAAEGQASTDQDAAPATDAAQTQARRQQRPRELDDGPPAPAPKQARRALFEWKPHPPAAGLPAAAAVRGCTVEELQCTVGLMLLRRSEEGL